MAATSSKAKLKTFAISYGFVGGPLHARRFKRLMREAGFEYELDPRKADMIVAHSAGCWLIPKVVDPKLIIYIGLPLAQSNPRQAWLTANRNAFKKGNIRRGLRVRVNTTYYLIRQPKRNIGIMRMSKTAVPIIVPKVPAIFIANKDDPWPQADKLEEYVQAHEWAFIGMPGSHDDIWENPGRYVKIIEHYARILG